MKALGLSLFTFFAFISSLLLLVIAIGLVRGLFVVRPHHWEMEDHVQTLLALTATSVLPFAWLRWLKRSRARRRRDERSANDQCSHCGYDLRASWIYCPECGQFIPLPLAGLDD